LGGPIWERSGIALAFASGANWNVKPDLIGRRFGRLRNGISFEKNAIVESGEKAY